MKPLVLCLAGLLVGSQSVFCSPTDMLVNLNGVDYFKSTSFTTWPTVPLGAGGGFTVSSPDPAGNIWLNARTTFGLTDTTFTCSGGNPCTGFVAAFALLGELIPNLAHVDISMTGNAVGGTFDAAFAVSMSAAQACPINNPTRGPFLLSGGFSVGDVVAAETQLCASSLSLPSSLDL